MDCFWDIYDASLYKTGEELCGDKVKILKNDHKTIVVLSDGLGSGVKANILASLTAEIIVCMLREDVPLRDVISTVIGTLPICKVRKIAYATFTAIEIDHESGNFKTVNFDNPPTFYFRKGKLNKFNRFPEMILDRQIFVTEGNLQRGDFMGIASDGVLHAGMGNTWNFGWGWDNVAKFLEGLFIRSQGTAQPVVQGVIRKTSALYGDCVGDDATFVGIYARERHSLMVFSGPPLDDTADPLYVERLLNFEGRKVVCGGTTGNIVAAQLGTPIETELASMREDVPPIGHLPEIDLMTEGIITMARSLELMRACRGEESALPRDRNGAVLLARELLRADSIYFLVGQKINDFYQNPLLPRNLSIRKNLILEIAAFLTEHKKEIKIEYC